MQVGLVLAAKTGPAGPIHGEFHLGIWTFSDPVFFDISLYMQKTRTKYYLMIKNILIAYTQIDNGCEIKYKEHGDGTMSTRWLRS